MKARELIEALQKLNPDSEVEVKRSAKVTEMGVSFYPQFKIEDVQQKTDSVCCPVQLIVK